MSMETRERPVEMSPIDFGRVAQERERGGCIGSKTWPNAFRSNALSIDDMFRLLVVGKVCCGLIWTHEALQHFRVGLGEVHEDESVNHIAETGVHVEAKNSPTQFQVMLQEDGDSRAV